MTCMERQKLKKSVGLMKADLSKLKTELRSLKARKIKLSSEKGSSRMISWSRLLK